MNLSNKLRLKFAATYCLHHSQMFEVVVRLEKGITSEEFDQDAANTPDVARVAPS